MRIEIASLAPDAVLPVCASPSTRAEVPRGYGVQEQCLPFTAAAGLGIVVRAPFAFGLCAPGAAPPGIHVFRPAEGAAAASDPRVFWVRDDPRRHFVRNAFVLRPVRILDARGRERTWQPIEPGLSFFDRADQRDLFKIHLPYVLRTARDVDTLFLPPINRPAPFALLSGLVETEWYPQPVNLVARVPATGGFAVEIGDPLAQLVLVSRAMRRAEPVALDPSSALAEEIERERARWSARHARDRSAYKRLARSRQGRIAESPPAGETPPPA
jgi:hypothetical protein